MKVSFVVHNRDRAEALAQCLASLARQTYRPLEVVVLDAGSRDYSCRVIEQAAHEMRAAGIEVQIHSCLPAGVPESRNLGARLATGHLLCFLDNDATLEGTGSIGLLVEHLRAHPRVGVLSFRVLLRDTEDVDPFAWVFRRASARWSRQSFRTFTFTGGGFCVRSEAYRSVGGFWTDLRYSREEEEMGLALIHAGWELEYFPVLTMRHYFDPNGRASVTERRVTELHNGILVLWRRLPAPLALGAIAGRLATMSLRLLLRREGSPSELLSALPAAIRYWRGNALRRNPISLRSSWKYARLHLSS